ncbi:MAG TPA: sigma-70 family RNA polymerase sigma factor [Phycisphaerae bacterium]|nr:sigma-70 family RNA polymerase sigma factor [Phycisphaerae bacterium]HNU46911.1 sigma-70 family RNA polymerase sigma factor [Phycisphaerae bacterium]
MSSPADLPSMIRRAQRLEPEAFEWLVDAYSARLYGFLWRLTGNRAEAEDLVQEVFVRVVRAIGGYQEDGRFDAWLFRIAANLARDRIRRLHRGREAAFVDEEEGEEPVEVSRERAATEVVHADPSAALELGEDMERLERALTTLPSAERQVILLRHYGNMSFAEVAEAMGTPLGTALARAHRGLRKLRSVMESEA